MEKIIKGHEKSVENTEKVVLKAKQLNKKVEKHCETQKEKYAKDIEQKKMNLEGKLQKAEEKRVQILE